MDAAGSRVLPSGALWRVGAWPQGWRAPGPVLQGLLALAIYLAAFAWYAMPLIRYLDMPVIGHTSPDSNFYVWSLRWLLEADALRKKLSRSNGNCGRIYRSRQC